MTTPSRDDLERWDRDHLWHPFTPMLDHVNGRPLIIERGQGCYLVDLDGNEYLDGVSSLWCNVFGHRVPELDGAIRDQLDRVAHCTLLGQSNVPAIQLARKLVEVAPEGMTRVFFSDNGATAVEVALKMAYQYWQQIDPPRPGKTRFLALHGAYHGDTLGDVSVGDLGLFHDRFRGLTFPVFRADSPYCYRCPLGLQRETCGLACVERLVDQIREHADELAAVVLEPLVQGAAGMITAPEGFLRRVREVTRECGVLLILDEVAVGCGRTGTMFACEQEGVVPDFLCLAKGLTGGYLPLAATLTTEEVFAAFLGRPEQGRTFYHGHTFTGNPLGAAVALATLEKLQGPDGLCALPPKIERLGEHLKRLAELPIVGEVRQRGLIAGIELVRDRTTRERFPASERTGRRVCDLAREQGVLLRPLGDVIVIMPPLAITGSMLDRLMEVLYNSLQRVAAG